MIELPERQAQANREVGVTEVTRRTARLVSLALLATVAAGGLAQPLAGPALGPYPAADWARPFIEFARDARDALERLRSTGALAANRELHGGLERFEDDFEAATLQRRLLLAPLQRWLAARLGLGNEQAIVGRAGTLYYRPDLEYATGRGFLEPAVLAARRRDAAGEGATRPEPDPLPALLDFDQELRARGIRLLLVPTPVKPVLQPEALLPRGSRPALPLHNPSYAELLRRLEAHGVAVLDLSALLADPRAGDRAPEREIEAPFLRTDTHWAPATLRRAAQAIAAAVKALPDDGAPSPGAEPLPAYRERRVVVEGLGDIAAMLDLAAGTPRIPAETVTVSMILGPDGRILQPERAADLLLLGDSFTNVYSDPGLGWGAGAGLAEQLAFVMGRPVDRLALNAGGAVAARRALAGEPERLRGKRVLVYQFALRELSSGDWQRVELPP